MMPAQFPLDACWIGITMLSTSDTVPVAVSPIESVTVTEKVNVVVAISFSVPVRAPSLDKVSPDGKSLDEKLYSPSPPLAVSVVLTSLLEASRLVDVRVSGSMVSTSDTVPVAVFPALSVTVTEKGSVVVAVSVNVPVRVPSLDKVSPDGKSLDENV
jgi:hypothetical protein